MITINDPGWFSNCATDIDRYVCAQFRRHTATEARLLAWKYGITWHRVTELSVDLSMTRHNTCRVPAAWEDGFEWADCGMLADEIVSGAFERCGSPIEELFLAALSHHSFRWKTRDSLDSQIGWVLGQHTIDQYRVDFAAINGNMKLVVELDGHEFHERTKQQAERDKSRDRALTAAGWRVLRFTGSEVWKNPHKCAEEFRSLLCAGVASL